MNNIKKQDIWYNMSLQELQDYKKNYDNKTSENLYCMNMQKAKFNPACLIDDNMSYVNAMIFIINKDLKGKSVQLDDGKLHFSNKLDTSERCKTFYIIMKRRGLRDKHIIVL